MCSCDAAIIDLWCASHHFHAQRQWHASRIRLNDSSYHDRRFRALDRHRRLASRGVLPDPPVLGVRGLRVLEVLLAEEGKLVALDLAALGERVEVEELRGIE